MFYYNSDQKPVQIFNTRRANFSAGGMVKFHPNNRFPNEDSISSALEPGSLVIPTIVMRSGIMDGYRGKTTDKKEEDMSKLSPTIIMPGEMVVAKRYAKDVERYLKKKGITLPLPA